MRFKSIIEENIPCWYELSWQKNKPAIILRIHQDFIENFVSEIKTSPLEWPMVISLMEKLKLTDFSGDFQEDIGFSKVFKRKGEKDGFVEFLITIPRIEKKTNKECHSCNGLGKEREPLEGECYWCRGTGKEYIHDWHLAEAISASFTIFTVVLSSSFSKKETSSPFPQLLTVETMTTRDTTGGSLWGVISIPLRNWLALLKDGDNLPEVAQATKTAYGHMFGELHHFSKYSFRAYSRGDGGFLIDCPGSASGLHPADWNRPKGKGYEFSCHNVDSSAQQITLLAGLAALHDKARREIKAY